MRDDCCNRHPHDSRCPYAPEPPIPVCPECEKEAEAFYFDKYKNIAGCDNCVYTKDAWEAETEAREYA
jgi:hypothetical protein